MLLSLTLSRPDACDLGYLLGKNPARAQSFSLPFGSARIFYPERTFERCTAVLALEIDPIALVRGRHGDAGLLSQYVNDRPFVASSFLSVAISRVYGSALAGRSPQRQDLADQALELEAKIAVVACRGGGRLLQGLFEPLGYQVQAIRHPLDPQFPQWGQSPYFTLTLKANCRLGELLSHLYVLLPVMDNEKHYFVGDDEVNKLLNHGEGWLSNHPLRDEITRRYLKYQSGLAREALARLDAGAADGNSGEETEGLTDSDDAPQRQERVRLHEIRLERVVEVLTQSGAKSVLDLGCGEGKLLRLLARKRTFEKIVGMDVSSRAVEIAQQRLERAGVDFDRIQLLHGSLLYRDARLAGFDAAAVVEVVEHLDPPRLAAFERALFEFAQPNLVVLTTPNREFNVRFESLSAGAFRHADHRFEWTRAEFRAWAEKIAERFGYRFALSPLGPEEPELGAASQMAVFQRGRA
jgi:3' terminal RNA ribose 2'-O-methyltransferase Hen1